MIIGALVAHKIKKIKSEDFKLVLSFSGSFLFAITLAHLIPDVFEMAHHIGHEQFGKIGLFMLLGFFIQKLLEYFSSGIEHGHIHHHTHISPVVILISLCLHSLLEGTILVPGAHVHHDHSGGVLWGVLLHHAPAAFVLYILFRDIKFSLPKRILYMSFFALSTPIGYLVSKYVLIHVSNYEHLFMILQAMVAGNFLHISTTLVLESNPDHGINYKKIISVLIGTLLAILSVMV